MHMTLGAISTAAAHHARLEEAHPWASYRDTPQRSISALELFGPTFLLETLSHNALIHPGLHTLQITLDNQGATYMGNKISARSWSSTVVAAQLGVTVEKTGLTPLMQHRHREQNSWADALSKGSLSGFDPARRLSLPPEDSWAFLRRMALWPEGRGNTERKRKKGKATPDRPPEPCPNPMPCEAGDVSPPAGHRGRDETGDLTDPGGIQYTAAIDLDKESLDWLLSKATRARWPASKRHWVQGTSVCLGLARGYSGEASINDGTYIADGFIHAVNGVLTAAISAAHGWFTWTSLQVNYNTVADWHVDQGNIGHSAMLVAGNFTGGEFVLEGSPPMALAGKLLIFSGARRHRSLPFSGVRLSIVAFNHPLVEGLPKALRSKLHALGFRF